MPFLVGLLLMHLEEEEAFSLLKYLMFHLGLRNQFKPDMTGLQVPAPTDIFHFCLLLNDFNHFMQLFRIYVGT